MYFNVELELALVAIQNCLVLLHDCLGPSTKKLWLHTLTHINIITILEPVKTQAKQRVGKTKVYLTYSSDTDVDEISDKEDLPSK